MTKTESEYKEFPIGREFKVSFKEGGETAWPWLMCLCFSKNQSHCFPEMGAVKELPLRDIFPSMLKLLLKYSKLSNIIHFQNFCTIEAMWNLWFHNLQIFVSLKHHFKRKYAEPLSFRVNPRIFTSKKRTREVPEVHLYKLTYVTKRADVLLHYQGHNNMALEDNKMIYPQQLQLCLSLSSITPSVVPSLSEVRPRPSPCHAAIIVIVQTWGPEFH